MANLRRLTDEVHVGGQILPSDFYALKSAGFKSIVNNRPDGEAPNQPSGDALGKAATDAGFDYSYIPMHGLDMATVLASVDAYETLPKPIAAFCASGTRTVMLWCFARVNELGIESVLNISLEAGFDLQHIRPALQSYKDQYC